MDAASRARLYEEVFAAVVASKTTVSAYLMPDLELARYTLGTSMADRVLPYVLEDSVRVVFRRAFKELACLYVGRNRRVLGEEAYDAFLLGTEESTVPLRPAAYTPPEQLKNPAMRAAMARAPRILTGLDCGVLASWWGSEGRGRELLMSWASLLTQAAAEMATAETGEKTPYLLQWILLECFQEGAAALAAYRVEESTRRELLAALLLGAHLSHHVVKQQTLSADTLEGLAREELRIRWTAVINPLVSFRSHPNLMQYCRFYPVGLGILGGERESVLSTLELGGATKAAAVAQAAITGDREVNRSVMLKLVVEKGRELLLKMLETGVREDGEVFRLCHAYLRDDQVLRGTLEDKKTRKEVVKQLEAEPVSPETSVPRAEFLDLLKKYNPKDPAKKVFSEKDGARRAVESVLAEAGDVLTARAASEVLKCFSPRTGAESDRSIAQQYDGGQLYRFGLGVTPFLKKYVRGGDVGHYFIDVKDYTRRTALLKEEIMADFIRREFYEPILAIAREFYKGLPQLEDRGGVYLNNLLGDALSYSGDIVALVGTARQIRTHLDAYAQNLSSRLDRSQLARKVQAIDARFQETQTRLQAWGEAGAEALGKLKSEREEAVGRVTGEHLVAGSFIAYGSAAVVVKFDDPVWGEVRVSVAEKINESARGTARSGSVISYVQAVRDFLRRRNNNPGLELPFRVYVGNTLDLTHSPEADLALRSAYLKGDQARIVQIYQHEVQQHIQNTIGGGQPAVEAYLARGMAIHNAGDALTGEALAAYRKAAGKMVRLEDRVVPVANLEPAIRQQFVFLEPQLRLVVGRGADGQVCDLFRYAGTMIFKGFERDAPTEIWEIVNLNEQAGQMLALSRTLA